MQSTDDNLLLASYQQGSLLAMRQLVRQYQDELLRTAYLLTGAENGSVTLAATAFLDLFQALPRTSYDRDSRSWLLELLAGNYLANRIAADCLPDMPLQLAADDSPQISDQRQHYQVDDERARTLAALERLDRPARVALVLTEFSGLDLNSASSMTGQSLEDLRRGVEHARDRVAEASGRDHRELRGPLSDLATSAPRVELWPHIEEPLEQIEARQQQRSRLLIGGSAVVACLVLLVGLGWLFAADAFDDGQPDPSASGPVPAVTEVDFSVPEPATDAAQEAEEALATPASIGIGVGKIPDLHVVTNTRFFTFANVFSGVSSVRLTGQAGGTSLLLENANRPVGVSPDGSWVLFLGTTWNEEYPDGLTTLAAYDTNLGTVAWDKTFFSSNWGPVALTPEQAYIGNFDSEIVSFNLETGIETGRWQLQGAAEVETGDTSGSATSSGQLIKLYIAPNQRKLYAFTTTEGSQLAEDGSQVMYWTRTMNTYLLPGMTLASSKSQSVELSPAQWDVDFSFWEARPTTDGSSLYALMRTETDDFAIRFLDLSSNAVEEIVLPFYSNDGDGRVLPHIVPSNSGQWLYVLSGGGQQVAIVDLLERRLGRVNPIDDSESGPLELSKNLYDQRGGYAPWLSTLTLDGNRLYLAIPTSHDDSWEHTTVLVIDTPTWRIIDRWGIPGRIQQMIASNDGDKLELHIEIPEAFIDRGHVESRLRTVDLEGNVIGESSGLELFPSEESLGIVELHSLAEVYRNQYGLAPVLAGVEPEDAPLESTLPDLEIDVAEPVIAGGTQAEISVRFLDPVSGDPLRNPRSDIRGDADAAVVITLTNGETDPIILQPVQMEDGAYRALTILEEPGRWAATASVNDGNGLFWGVRQDRAVDVIQSFAASDGKRYYPSYFSDPEHPVAGELFTIGIAFRNIDSKLPIPEDVDLLDGLPEEIRVSFIARDLGVASKTLEQVEHGRYEGERGFRDPAKRELTFQFNLDGEAVSIWGGSMVVESPPAEQ